MKNELYIIQKYLFKYKYILLSFLIIFSFLYFLGPIKEGLTTSVIGQYDYLAPPQNNTWSDTTWQAFIPVYNLNNCPTGSGPNCLSYPVNPNAQQMFYQTTTEAEALYYIQNNTGRTCR